MELFAYNVDYYCYCCNWADNPKVIKMMKQFFNGFKEGIKNFGHNITAIVNSSLLFIVYFIGVGITAIIAKIFRKRFLDMKKKKNTYWSNLNLRKNPIEEYYRQF